MKKILLLIFFILTSLFGEIKNSNNSVDKELEMLKKELAELKKFKEEKEKEKAEKEYLEKLNALLPVKNSRNGLNVLTSSTDGKSLYRSCMGCHGAKGLVRAMGYSKQISKMTPNEIKKSIIGYQKGYYGGKNKMLMKNYVLGIRDKNDINILANYISRLDENR